MLAAAPIRVPVSRNSAFERVAPANGCEAM